MVTGCPVRLSLNSSWKLLGAASGGRRLLPAAPPLLLVLLLGASLYTLTGAAGGSVPGMATSPRGQ
jgi:hypothetical protein